MTAAASDATTAEVMVIAMAREAATCGVVAQGIATPLVTAALLLAKRCFAPGLEFAYAVGNSLGGSPDGADLGAFRLIDAEAETLGRTASRFDFVYAAGEYLPRVNPAEFFRPAQIDATGATNNVCIGPYATPRLRLPGAAGIPDVSVTSKTARLYVPRHSPRVFVERLDFVSGAGAGVAPGPVRVFTDLAVLTLRHGRLGVEWLMPGVTPDAVVAATGFRLEPGPVAELEDPAPAAVVEVLRTEVDPRGLRDLDFLPARARHARLLALAAEEEAAYVAAGAWGLAPE